MVPDAKCPRCGYDLRGAVSSWETACPLAGTCTECGLAFDWAHVLRPAKFEPPWCVEFAPRRGVAKSCVSTLVRSVWPPGFWAAVRMSQQPRRARLAVYAGLIVAALVAGSTIVQAAAAVRLRYKVEQELASNPWGPTIINHTYAAAITEAVLFRWRRRSSGSFTLGGMIQSYPPPCEVLDGALDYLPVSSIEGVGFCAWMWLALPAGFVLLPVSRRRARVRWGHIVRVAVYGLSVPAILLLAGMGNVVGALAVEPLRDDCAATARLLIEYAPVPLLILWWSAAIRRYLCMPHGLTVAFLLAVLAALLYLALLLLVYLNGLEGFLAP